MNWTDFGSQHWGRILEGQEDMDEGDVQGLGCTQPEAGVSPCT